MSNPAFGFPTTASEVSTHFAHSITNKTILVTGVSPTSMSYPLITSLLPHSPASLILASRTPANLTAVLTSLPASTTSTHPIPLDLASLPSVRAAAAAIIELGTKIDILIHNAAIMAPAEFQRTDDGFEAQMATNHLGHFLLYNLLRKGGALAEEHRVVSVSSLAHEWAELNLEDPWFEEGKTYERWAAYSRSKTANILFATELASRGVAAYAVHPGAVTSNLAREFSAEELKEAEGRFEWKTLEQGASTLLVAALDDGIDEKRGAYFVDCQVHPAKEYATDKELAGRLWKWSEEQVGERFDF